MLGRRRRRLDAPVPRRLRPRMILVKPGAAHTTIGTATVLKLILMMIMILSEDSSLPDPAPVLPSQEPDRCSAGGGHGCRHQVEP